MRGSPLLSLVLLLLSLGAPLHAAALRVKGDARGPVHDGTTWDTAFRTIQDALDASHDGDEIRVAWTAEAQNLVVVRAWTWAPRSFRPSWAPCRPSASLAGWKPPRWA